MAESKVDHAAIAMVMLNERAMEAQTVVGIQGAIHAAQAHALLAIVEELRGLREQLASLTEWSGDGADRHLVIRVKP